MLNNLKRRYADEWVTARCRCVRGKTDGGEGRRMAYHAVYHSNPCLFYERKHTAKLRKKKERCKYN